MKKVLLDINILLDVLQKRELYYQQSAAVLSHCEQGRLKGFIAANSFGTLFYLLRQELSLSQTMEILRDLRSFTKVAPIDERMIDQALQLTWKDFEDALQYVCALRCGARLLITRNKKDFSGAKIAVLTPAEFLASLS